MLRAAVLQQLTAIGEASRSVSNQLRERHPDVPWRRIADFRNVAVHEYWSLVWRLARDLVPMYDLEIIKMIEVGFPDTEALFKTPYN